MREYLKRFFFKRMNHVERLHLVFWQLVIVTAITLLPLGQLTDLASHFKLQYLFLALVCCVGFIILRKRVMAIVAAAMVCVNGIDVLPVYESQTRPSYEMRVKLVQLNVHTANRAYQKTLDYIRQAEPDIISFQELDAAWVNAILPLKKEYPYTVICSREDNFGIALFSRYPLQNPKIRSAGVHKIPSIHSTVRLNGDHSIALMATHPLPPVLHYQARNRQLADVAQWARAQKHQVVVIGDLNITPFSPAFKSLLAQSRLKDSMAGFGSQASWPSILFFAGIPIDHVLISDTVAVLNRETGPYIGSDHLPVSITLGL